MAAVSVEQSSSVSDSSIDSRYVRTAKCTPTASIALMSSTISTVHSVSVSVTPRLPRSFFMASPPMRSCPYNIDIRCPLYRA